MVGAASFRWRVRGCRWDAPCGDGVGAEHQSFGDAAAEQCRDPALEWRLAGCLLSDSASGRKHWVRRSARCPARKDGSFVHRIVLGQRLKPTMAWSRIGEIKRYILLRFSSSVRDHGAALGAHHDLILWARWLETSSMVTETLVAARRNQRAFGWTRDLARSGGARETRVGPRAITDGFLR